MSTTKTVTIDEKQLTKDYFELWKTADDDTRHTLMEKLFAESAVKYVAPANVSIPGIEAIEANIARVNKENIQEAGLEFRAGETVVNHNSAHMNWEVVAGGKKVVGSGRDFLLFNDDGQVTALYMFMYN